MTIFILQQIQNGASGHGKVSLGAWVNKPEDFTVLNTLTSHFPNNQEVSVNYITNEIYVVTEYGWRIRYELVEVTLNK